MLPAVIGPSGLDTNLQPALFRNSIAMWAPSSGTSTGAGFGSTFTTRNSGTSAALDHPNINGSSDVGSMRRARAQTGTTATGTSGIQSTVPVAVIGNAATRGGFFFAARLSAETYREDLQLFVGLSARNGNLGGEPSAQNNSVGLCKDSTDTDWHILTRNGSAATKTPLQTALPVTQGQILDLMMFVPPGGNVVTFRVVDAVTNTVYADGLEVTSTLPVNTTALYMHFSIRSTVGTTTARLACNRMYVESDL